MLEPQTLIQRSPRAVYRNLTGGAGAVVLHLDTAAYYGVNLVGAIVWNLLEQEITVQRLVEELRGRLEAGPTTLGEEIREFVQQLVDRDLVRLKPAAVSPSAPAE
jgi:Coenzyme PQQ synthesis protein D (PqqD)